MPDESVMDAIRKMSMHQVDCLPVIVPLEEHSTDPEVIGWVSKSSIIRMLADIASVGELEEPDL
ncbi:hypothetical protein D3C80_2087220 [compost metagenome]